MDILELISSKITYTYEGEIDYDEQTGGKLPLIKMANTTWEELGKLPYEI